MSHFDSARALIAAQIVNSILLASRGWEGHKCSLARRELRKFCRKFLKLQNRASEHNSRIMFLHKPSASG
jgi:hypothetical protein